MKLTVATTYIDRDCTLFVWSKPVSGVQVVATSEEGAAREFFGPGAFVQTDEAFEAGAIPESRIGRFIHGSPPLDPKAFATFALDVLRQQHG